MGGPGGYAPTPTANYAGWWRRVGAAVIDGIIGVVFMIPAIAVLFAGPTEVNYREDGFDGAGFYEEPTGTTIAIAVLLYAVGFIIYLVIYCRMLGKGATWGRKAAGYRVLDAATMQPIGTGRAVGRYFATILSALPCYLGFLWPLWDGENRTFHDMIVNTRAILN
jgi:uncharacterized RDD family membrane protein YckC